ncbi:MAG: zf-HC2 domain-containing protein [Acidobacteria bacterium]|nr:zf-HC2 domain-containing protein [Acidobacteriota bacterium]
MTCDDFAESISALVDGSLDPAHRPRVEAHIEACDDCRALLDDLRALGREASVLPRSPLPDSLWPRVAARLREQGVRDDRAPSRAALWQWGAIAAMLVAAVGLSLMLTWTRRPALPTAPSGAATQEAGHAETGARPAAAGNAGGGASVEGVEAELRMAEEHYERAISGLEQVAASDQSSLDPQVAATVKRNLEVIDRAIAESRTALSTEPQNQPARESLFEALRRKIGLLQDTIALMNEMRKGNQAGAARIVEGNKS